MKKSTREIIFKIAIIAVLTSLGSLAGGIFIFRDLESILFALFLSVFIWPAVIVGVLKRKRWFGWFIFIWALPTFYIPLAGAHIDVELSMFSFFCFIGAGIFACLSLRWLTF